MLKLLVVFLFMNSAMAAGHFSVFMKDFYGREVHIYLPEDYGKSDKDFPVLYMHDGQNLYDPSRAYMGQTWKAQETLNQLIARKLIEPMIVIAIDNSSQRMNEYTHDFDQSVGRGGKADEYLARIVYDLMPLVSQRFRVKQGRQFTAMGGSSLGGLLSLYAGVKYDFIFGKVAALSPSIWWNDKSIIPVLTSAKVLPEKLYLDSGTDGGEKPKDVEELSLILNPRFANRALQVQIGQGDQHNESAWARRLPFALIHLFPYKK